ncbi:MAG: hypothetical protein ACQESW_11585 [Bacteroidota bacterium]
MKLYRLLFPLLVFVTITYSSKGQFYNGHQQSFGKNRVQYTPFYWMYLEYDFGQIYFTTQGEPIARQVGRMVPEVLDQLSRQLNTSVAHSWKIVVYNSHSDYLQRNSGLITGSQQTNTGGQTELTQGKIMLYFTGSYQELHQQLTLEMARQILHQQLYGTQTGTQMANQTVMELPPWFIEGAAGYFAQPHTKDGNGVKEYLTRYKHAGFWPRHKQLQPQVARSVFSYIAHKYGADRIPDIVAFTRLYNHPEKAFIAALGRDFKQIQEEWRQYYLQEASNLLETPIRSSRPKGHLYHASLSPDANKLAYVRERFGKKHIHLYNFTTKKTERLWQGGFRTMQITDKSHPVIAWLPDNKNLAFIAEEEGTLKLYFYDTQNEKLRSRNFPYFEKIQQFRFSPDGTKFVLAATKNGQRDIYEFLLASNSVEQYTHDLANDRDPIYLSNEKILFASNRNSDSLNLAGDFKSYENTLNLYQFQPGDSLLTRMTYEPTIEQQALENAGETILLTETENHNTSLSLAQTDSTILAIDTTIHYRYMLKIAPLKAVPTGFSGFTTAANEEVYAVTTNLPKRAHISTLQPVRLPDSMAFRPPYFTREKEPRETAEKVQPKSNTDSTISLNKYVFEQEKPDFAERHPKRYKQLHQPAQDKRKDKYRLYPTTFFIQEIGSQVDFSYLQQAYQPFTGGAVYPNPGISGFFKLGAYDLFEDYKLTAGLKFSADLTANEYIFSLEHLKDRWNKHLTYYRQSLKQNREEGKLNTHSNQLTLDLSYPFDEVQRITLTLGGRTDRIVPMATSRQSLIAEVHDRWWLQGKAAYVYDNTLKLTENIYEGLRAKIFIETHQQVNNLGKGLYVTGADFRYYLPVHRELIWATRIAYSSSFGNQRLIYYLGGVDNWVHFSSHTPMFIPLEEIPVDNNTDYQFQAVATNMRGFSQNIRNGSSFAILNTELRWPVFRYFIHRPINASLINHFQWVGFFDVGSAWSGLHPFNSDNAFDVREVARGPITIRIDTERSPLVAGYGTGIRTKLLGYFMRFDYAWGVENGETLPGIFYFSLSLDF